MKNWKTWAWGLVNSLINAVAGAILVVIAIPDKFSFDDMSDLLRVMVAFALVGCANYMKDKDIPPLEK